MTLTFTDADFEEQVKQAELPVLVDFYADWCGPCRSMSPVVDRMAERFEGKLLVGRLNVDENPESTAAYRVRSIPYLALFQNGKVVDHMIGAGGEEELEWMIRRIVD